MILFSFVPGSGGSNENAPALTRMNANDVQAKAITSLYVHAKMALADYNTTGQVVYPGSGNFSSVSPDQNRELRILVTEKPILDRLESVFSEYWQVPGMKET